MWGDKGKADQPAKKPMTVRDGLVKIAAPVAVVGEVARQGVPAVPEVVTKSVEHVGAWRGVGKSVLGIWTEVAGLPWQFLAVAGVAGGVLAYLRIRERQREQNG
jgi:hypothetical protein